MAQTLKPPGTAHREAPHLLPHLRQSRVAVPSAYRQRAATAPLSIWAVPLPVNGGRAGGSDETHTPRAHD
jgi:hypothetical protein